MRSRILPSLVLCLAVAVACTETSIPTSQAPAVVAPSPGARVAQAIAVALGDDQVRASLAESFRQSPYVGFKVMLNDYLGTPGGAILLDRGAAALDVDRDAFRDILTSLPPLQLWTASAEDRERWNANGDVVVGYRERRGAQLHVYAEDGGRRSADDRSGFAALLLEPAGLGLRRIEGRDYGIQYVMTDANGRQRTIDVLAEADGKPTGPSPEILASIRPCVPSDVDDCSGGGAGGLPGSGIGGITYVQHLHMPGCDGWGGPEIEVYAYEFSASGVLRGTNMLRFELGCSVGDAIYHGSPVALLSAVANGDGRRIQIHLRETDFHADDDFVDRNLTSHADYNVWLTFHVPWHYTIFMSPTVINVMFTF